MSSKLRGIPCSKWLGSNARRGFVLLMVLVAVILLTLSAYSFTIMMVAEEGATILAGQRTQSRLLVASGAESVRLVLAQDDDAILENGGLWDNPNVFQAVQVRQDNPADASTSGYFSVVGPQLDDAGYVQGQRYGLIDESTRLNLQILPKLDEYQEGSGKQLLMALPEMTEEVADAILDWIDTDEEVRTMGAESSYYMSQSPPYSCKNGPLSSVEELLLVRGVTPELLFGNDVNRNGVLDDEEQVDRVSLSDDPDMQLGWANFMTIFSQEANLNREGLQRINLNEPDLEQLERDLSSVLSSQWVNFILAYRINGPYQGEIPEDEENGPPFGEIDLTDKEGSTNFLQVLDLIDATTSITWDGETTETVLQSPLQSTDIGGFGLGLATVMDNLTTVSAATIPGRINIMQAPRRVIASIPGLTEDQVELILSRRQIELNDPNVTDLNYRYETWLLLEMIVDLPTMRTISPFICCKGDVYRAEIVGYFENGEATSRAEVVYDTTEALPRLLFWRDKSHLPLGNSVARLGIVPANIDE